MVRSELEGRGSNIQGQPVIRRQKIDIDNIDSFFIFTDFYEIMILYEKRWVVVFEI